MGWSSADMPSQAGKRFVVTGGNTGIGLATVIALASKGAAVVLACRDADKGRAALAEVRNNVADAAVSVESLDLASLASVRAFAEGLLARGQPLDGLINNAGVMAPPLAYTEDGFESQFGTNFIGHFALTGHLLPLLNQAPAARVVSLSSLAHRFGRIDFDNLNAERGYDKIKAYSQSKLADLVFTYELQRRLARSGARTISIGAHPGVTASELSRHGWHFALLLGNLGQTTTAGALPSLMAATAPTVRGGDYVGPGGLLAMRGAPRVQPSSAQSHDATLGGRLWEVGQKLSGVSYL